MGKYLQFFSQQYGCPTMATGTEVAGPDGTVVVKGSCVCRDGGGGGVGGGMGGNMGVGGVGGTCTFQHTIDAKGNVVRSEEAGCPCASASGSTDPFAPRGQVIRTQTTQASKGQRVGRAIAIAVSVVSGVIILIGIIFIAKRSGTKGHASGHP